MNFPCHKIKNLGCNEQHVTKQRKSSLSLETGREELPGQRGSFSQRAGWFQNCFSQLVTGFRGLRATFTRGARVVG